MALSNNCSVCGLYLKKMASIYLYIRRRRKVAENIIMDDVLEAFHLSQCCQTHMLALCKN